MARVTCDFETGNSPRNLSRLFLISQRDQSFIHRDASPLMATIKANRGSSKLDGEKFSVIRYRYVTPQKLYRRETSRAYRFKIRDAIQKEASLKKIVNKCQLPLDLIFIAYFQALWTSV